MKTETIKGDLIMEKNMTFDGHLVVEGNIFGKDGEKYNLRVEGDLTCEDLTCMNLNCWDLNCGNLNCLNLNCGDLTCFDLNCGNLNCWDLNCLNLNCLNLNCWNLTCGDLTFYAIAIAYYSFKCKSWKARRENYVIKCLDGEIEVTGEDKTKEIIEIDGVKYRRVEE